jgi:pilus assembly protein Flp/PilA
VLARGSRGGADRRFRTLEHMKKRWLHLLNANAGMTAIEYAMIAALLSVAAITGVGTLGSKVNTNFQFISNSMN